MAQHDYNLINQSGANFRADLNNALSAIATNNAGTSAPSTTFKYEWWIDEASGVLKIRNSANSAWITTGLNLTTDNLFTGDITGNAPTATILATSRTINGVAFNGSANISFDSDAVVEGSSNLYFTTARARSAISATGDISYNSSTGVISFTGSSSGVTSVNTLTGAVVLTTANIGENTNLYFTDARARAAISEGSTQLSYNSTTGVLTFTQGDTDTVSEGSNNLYYTSARANADFDTRLATKSTSNLAEGTNLYYTTSRFDSAFGNKTTANLSENTNLYFTNARADTRINLQTGANLDLSSKSTTNLSEGTNLYYTDARFDTRLASKDTDNISEGTSNLYYTSTRFNSAFSSKSTSDLSEGTNLYYTDARAQAVSINNVVEDTTPQLGGNLDVNGNAIISTSNAAINLDPNGSGVVVFKGNATKGSGQFKLNCEANTHGITIKGAPHSAGADYTLTLPNDAGSSSQVLTTNGSGVLSWSTPSSGGSTPSITDNGNANAITINSNEDVTFSEDAEFATNKEIRMGDNDQFALYNNGYQTFLKTQNSINNDNIFNVRSDTTKLQATNGQKTSATFQAASSVDLYHNNVKKFETTTSGIDITGTVNLDNLTIAGAQGTNGQVLTSTGSGIGWATGGGGSYNDASVDAHLNRSTASSGEVLSWNGSDYDWVAQSGGGSLNGSYSTNIFTATSGQTAFTLSTSVSNENNLMVFVDGVFQAQNTYSTSGTTLTFATGIVLNRVVTVYHIETATTVTPSDNTVSTAKIVDDAVTSAKLDTNIAIGGTLNVGGTGTFTGLVDAAIIDGANFKVNGAQGTDGQVLTSTGSGVAWEDASGGGGSSGINVTKVSIASDQNIGRNTTTQLNFDTIEFGNSDSAFNTTTKKYTAPAAGKYQFTGRMITNTYDISGNSTISLTAYIYKNNSALIAMNQDFIKATGSKRFITFFDDIVELAQGDVIDFRASMSNYAHTTDATIWTYDAITHMSIIKH